MAFAVLLTLWCFGAYNRLVRERGQVIRAFGALNPAIEERAAVLLTVSHAQLLNTRDAAQQALWSAMEACVQQAANSAAHAATKPLDAKRVAALSRSLLALDQALAAVQSAGQMPSHLPGSAPWPSEVQAQLARSDARLLMLTEDFDAKVADYNASLAQFPTLLVAWLFGLKPAQTLR